MIEKFLVYLLVKIFNYLKKKYPNGEIASLAIIEVDKLDDQLKAKLDELTPQEAKDAVIAEAKTKIEDLAKIVKDNVAKLGGNK